MSSTWGSAVRKVKDWYRDGPEGSAHPGKRLLVITVDVEALPGRQEGNLVDRLIWGRYDRHEAGLRQMVEIADANGFRLSFFTDFCESSLHGPALDEVAEFVVASGHDLQLHAHTEVLPTGFWEERRLRPAGRRLERFSPEHAEALLRFLVERARACGQPDPVAIRGGGFRFNAPMLEAMAHQGVPLSFNYHSVRHRSLGLGTTIDPFRWSNGVIEVPMTIVDFDGRPRAFSFTSRNGLDVRDVPRVRRYINSYLESRHGDAVLVMLLHSWSFLDLDQGSGHFVYTDDRLLEAFKRLLGNLPDDIEVVTAADLANLVKRNEVELPETRDLDLFDRVPVSA